MWCGVASHVRLDGHEGDVAASFRPLDVLDDLYQVQRREAGFADVLPDVAALFGTINMLPPGKEHESQPSFARPDQLILDSDIDRCFAKGTIRRVEFLGSVQRVTLDLGESGELLSVDVPSGASLRKGATMGVRWRVD